MRSAARAKSPRTERSFRRRVDALWTFAMAAPIAIALGACGGDDPVVESLTLTVHGPNDGESNFNSIGFPRSVDHCVQTLRLTSYRGLKVEDQETPRWNESGVRLPVLPFGSDVWVSVEGLSNGAEGCPPSGRVVASGATPRLEYSKSSTGPFSLDVLTVASKTFTSAYSYWSDVSRSESSAFELSNQVRAGHTITELPDGTGYVVIGGANMTPAGGENGGIATLVDTIEFYDAYTNRFFALFDDTCTGSDPNECALRLPEPIAFHTATALDDGRILIVGGLTTLPGSTSPFPTSRAYVLEITGFAAGSLTHVDFAPGATEVARAFHTATKMDDGRVVIIGGIGQTYASPTYLSSVQQVAPTEPLEISETGVALSAGRALHSADYFARDGHGILVLGGRASAGVVSATEVLFATSTDFSAPLSREEWNTSNTEQGLRQARFGHSTVVFSCPGNPVKHLAVIGGYTSTGAQPLEGSAPSATVEFYDPGARFDTSPLYAFSAATATLPGGGRAYGSAVELPLSGDVLYMGGVDGDGVITNKADRLQNDWDPCGELGAPQAVPGGMGTARAHAASLMLSSGFALVTGGQGATQALSTSEFYNPDDFELVGLAP